MNWSQLYNVFKKKPGEYLLWLFANLGGILITYLALFTIWIFHGRPQINAFPNNEIFLVTGTIALAIAGTSYVRVRTRDTSIYLSPLLSISWPILLMFTYGVFIANAVKESIRGKEMIWIISIFLFLCLMVWASIIWLHREGIKIDQETMPSEPQEPEDLKIAALNLPKVKE